MSAFPPLPSHPAPEQPHAPGAESYAATLAHNAPPTSEQPTPQQPVSLDQHASHGLPDVDRKVNVVDRAWVQHPETETSRRVEVLQTEDEYTDEEEDEEHTNVPGSQKRKARKAKARRDAKKKEEDVGAVGYLQRKLFQPAVFGGIFSVVNIGLLSTLGYILYTKPHTRTSPSFLTVSGLSLATLFAGEGYAAETYLNTPRGKREKERAEREGAALVRHTKEVVLRPGVFGGIFGAVNLAVIAGLGYFTYTHWDSPGLWTRKNISFGTIGALSWIASQGFVAEKYRQDEYYKRR